MAPLVLRDADGDELDVVPATSRRVVIDRSVIEGDSFHVKGWSADTAAKVVPSEILVFFGDQLAFHGPPNLTRADVPDWFGSERLALSGYDIAIPAAEIPDGTQRVTVAARFGDVTVVEYGTLTDQAGDQPSRVPLPRVSLRVALRSTSGWERLNIPTGLCKPSGSPGHVRMSWLATLGTHSAL